jgi:hypothetical protein
MTGVTISRGLQRVESADAPSAGVVFSPAALRLLLLAGGGGAVVAASWLGQSAALGGVEPGLARLLQGLALLKGLMVVTGASLILWRFGQPISPRLAFVYLGCLWLSGAASTLIWQLAFLPAAAVGFHLGELTFLFAAWRDHQARAPAR